MNIPKHTRATKKKIVMDTTTKVNTVCGSSIPEEKNPSNTLKQNEEVEQLSFCLKISTKQYLSKDGKSCNKSTNVLSRIPPLMSRIERKYCLISTSYLTGLFEIFILLHI